MGLRIKTNVEALFARRRMEQNTRQISDSMEKLASGSRINKAADDAAGLAVSERIRATTRSLKQAKQNASDGISYIQVAEGGLNSITNLVVRMRELASQAASDTIGNTERGFLNKEFQQLKSEIVRVVDTTEFNGTKLLSVDDDSSKSIQIFVGSSNRGNDAEGNAPEINEEANPDVLTIDLTDLDQLTNALSNVVGDGMNVIAGDNGATDLGEEGTEKMFNYLDTALNDIAGFRATLGSVQSRLNNTVTNIEVTHENMSAALSRVRDVDFAEETAKFTKAKILSQASASMMTQANAKPELVLSLLR